MGLGAAAPGAWTVQSEGSGGSYLDGWEGGREGRSGVTAALLALTCGAQTPASTKQNKGKNITCDELNKVKP